MEMSFVSHLFLFGEIFNFSKLDFLFTYSFKILVLLLFVIIHPKSIWGLGIFSSVCRGLAWRTAHRRRGSGCRATPTLVRDYHLSVVIAGSHHPRAEVCVTFCPSSTIVSEGARKWPIQFPNIWGIGKEGKFD
jgi:hypothetical protein